MNAALAAAVRAVTAAPLPHALSPAVAVSAAFVDDEGAALPAAVVKDLTDARAGRLSAIQVMDRASALQAAGDLAGAARLYETGVLHSPGPMLHVLCFNWGTVLSALGLQAQAQAAYEQALQQQPGFAPAQLNLGHLHERAGQHGLALSLWQAVATQQPAPSLDLRLHAHNNSARLLEVLRRYPEAEAQMRASLLLKPGQGDVIQHYVHIRQKQCAWPHDLAVGAVTPHQFLTGTSLLAMMGLHDDPALQLLAAQRFVNEKVPKPPAVPLYRSLPPTAGPRQGRVKVAYLSGDLHMHAVGLLMPELLELHDRSRFEVWAFDWSPESLQPQRLRILKAIDQHVRLNGVDDNAAARLIAQAGIDVLVDLQGLTNGARPAILVQRPAPVQVSYLGLPGTSAIPGVEWMLADRYVMPTALLPYCTEQPLYLPHCYQVSDRQRAVAPKPERARYSLPDDAFVFCSFNNNHKFTAEMFAAWLRIVAGVPGSVLWLLADNDTARENMLCAADAQGVARDRLIFAPRAAPPEYLARFALADLMLDTFPFNAGTTASDALWMGLPIVTRSGRSYISRMAGSLLHAVGLPELVCDDLPSYEKLATALGQRPARVRSYQRYLAEQGRASPLFDLPQTVRDIEAHFERLALAARAS